MNRINKMRTKNFLIVLCCIIMTSMVLIIMGPSSVPSANDSTIRTIFSQTNQQLQQLKVSGREVWRVIRRFGFERLTGSLRIAWVS